MAVFFTSWWSKLLHSFSNQYQILHKWSNSNSQLLSFGSIQISGKIKNKIHALISNRAQKPFCTLNKIPDVNPCIKLNCRIHLLFTNPTETFTAIWINEVSNVTDPGVNSQIIVVSFIYPTDAQLDCSKNIKIYIKIYMRAAPTCFNFSQPSSGSYYMCFAKVISINIQLQYVTYRICSD